MLWILLLTVVLIFTIQVFIALKLKDKFCDLDRRFEKIDYNQLALKSQANLLVKKVDFTSLEIQNTTALTALGLKYPVFLGGWSIDSFLGRWLSQHLLENRPQCIVEIGSGSSTTLIARTMELLGENNITHFSVDHDKRYLDITRDITKLNGLEDRIEFIHAPLVHYEEIDMLWYESLSKTLNGHKIDLLIVDAPPGQIQPLSRYPAMPLLVSLLNEHCTVVLDDASRDEEQQIAHRWTKENPTFNLEIIQEGHGMAILSRQTI